MCAAKCDVEDGDDLDAMARPEKPNLCCGLLFAFPSSVPPLKLDFHIV